MGESADGSQFADGTEDPADSSAQRGFFGRILSALSPSEAGEDADAPVARKDSSAPGAVLPGIANLRKLRVDDVAIPKAEVIAVPVTISLDDLVAKFRESGFSRLPVFKGTLDSPLGIVHLKDLALQQAFSDAKPRFSLRKLLRPLLYAPPSMPIGVLLQKMQSERIHMALVIDEYGGVDGLVTIEDLIETVIGEIEDEHDTSESGLWSQEKPGQYIVQARAPLDEFESEIGMKLADEEEGEEIDTLGGLVFMLTGRVPARGEVVPHESGAEFEVVDADPRRIKRLRVRLPRR
ncbi:hemolysin family protein [Defluviimonas sp. WL0002]|uniref:Hemolysin family protein n=1 Tax=Albidovulum marisflavi TaxID=2984159 RepID=A0ABT2ZCA8_9RHOB|nr:hemolysin family protein [Defluviimonas sp. WL0002]MCV2868767.1 hemolysin family protein [Defluviimonas sp. WL0002]